MPRHSSITSLDDLQTWFTGLKHPRWNLYRGHQERKGHSTLIYKQTDESLDMATSWDTLRNMIEMNSGTGGQFTVYVPTVANGNQGMSVLVSINMQQHSGRGTMPAVSGTGYGLGMIPVEKVQEEIQKERKIWELEKRLEDMESAQEAGLGINDILKENLRGIDFNPIISGIVAMAAQRFGVMPGVQLQGTPADMAPEEEPHEGLAPYAYDGKLLKPILDTIRPHFGTDEDFYNFLAAVAQSFAGNPVQFKTMFGYA